MLLTHVVRDLKYALRTQSRTPGFSIIAVVVMALCIGAATSLFTIMRSVPLGPLPFRDPGRLVIVHEHFRGALGRSSRGGIQIQLGCTGGLLRLALQDQRL